MNRLLLIAGVLLTGCGVKESARHVSVKTASPAGGVPSGYDSSPATAPTANADRVFGRPAAMDGRVSFEAETAEVPPTEGAPPKLTRKLIYHGDLRLQVEDFEPLPDRVAEVVREQGGYVAAVQVSGSSGEPRSGRWKMRFPIDRYDAALAALKKLGEVQSVGTKTDDVSERYYDLERRIAHHETVAKRLEQHLAADAKELKGILAVEEQLSRVGETIEQFKGQLQVLKDLTAMSTIELYIQEIRRYVPEESPAFGARLERAFSGSWESVRTGLQDFAVWLAEVSLWLLIWIPLLVLGFVVVRRVWRRWSQPSPPA